MCSHKSKDPLRYNQSTSHSQTQPQGSLGGWSDHLSTTPPHNNNTTTEADFWDVTLFHFNYKFQKIIKNNKIGEEEKTFYSLLSSFNHP